MASSPLLRLGIIALVSVLAVACGAAATPAPAPAEAPASAQLPAPTDTAVPAEEPEAVSQELGPLVMGYLTGIVNDLGSRESASDEEIEAAEYLRDRYSEFGYPTEFFAFNLERHDPEASGLTFHLENPGSEDFEVLPLQGSAMGEVSGLLTPVGLAKSEDVPEGGLEGRVALIQRGEITFERKVQTASEAGAVGVVIYNNLPGNFQGNLGGPSEIPVAAVSQADGERLIKLLETSETSATLTLRREEVPSRNVLAEKVGGGNGVVIIGAHFDTVPGVEGANDNASGTASILALAQQVSDKSFPFSIKFISFGAEEIGLFGSRAYVDSLSEDERDSIIAMLNFDTVGSGTGLGVLGDSRLTDIAVEHAASNGIDLEVSQEQRGGTSDHAPFAAAEIPALFFYSNDSSFIHTEQDTLDTINPELPGNAVRIGLDVLDALAASEN